MIRFGNITIDRETQTITHGLRSRHWRINTRRDRTNNTIFAVMVHLLLAGGVTVPWLFDRLYDEDADGGPIARGNIISVILTQQVKPAAAELGLRLNSRRHNSRSVYWLTPVAA